MLNLVGLTELIDLMIKLNIWPLLLLFLTAHKYFISVRTTVPRKVALDYAGHYCHFIMDSHPLALYYVSQFASYNETYGSLGGMIMLMWLYISAYFIVFGAAANASIEKQTLLIVL